ncbi:MAG: PEP/pyruvate-binding domain-containing protein [Sedimentisphaerales bacterium]|nr:PEP/pyruvate-binding domain-containing protein [Sedimentisphaerales bacterium]
MHGWASTGIDSLDTVFTGLNKGDNVVWQVDGIEDFIKFVTPYVEKAISQQRKVVYMRFASHEPFVKPGAGVKIYELSAYSGFETFTTQVHEIIASEGKEAYYVFDCLSYLLDAWATDLMIGNFFMVTCPFLYELDTIAYFALIRNRHSFKTIARIRDTTQLLIDLYNIEDKYCVHPLKVWKRYSATMFLPHLQQDDKFVPITSSVDATKLISYISERSVQHSERILDYWDKLFAQAAEIGEQWDAPEQERYQTIDRLCSVMIGRDERMLSLVKKHFTIEDLQTIKSRLIGTGFIGGKAVGMLLANKIISKQEVGLKGQIEPHDSFYVGSDVFYTYLVENGLWKLRVEQKTKEGYFKAAAELREKLLKGKFPDQIREQFQEMIEYYGQSPIIVRSSSLLEDAFGNAFAGKYESIFCVNQGTPEERYTNFEEAVRRVFASTMDEDALTYRLQRGLDQSDEQMALLVQRVSGSYRGSYFFPDLAGVGLSHNAFVWKPDLNPAAGMIRLVFGLGTRAVNRVEDDYPRIISLDQPLARPISGVSDIRKYSQHNVDLLDTKDNCLKTVLFSGIVEKKFDIKLEYVAVRDYQLARLARQKGENRTDYWLLTFEKLLTETTFVNTMQKILKTLEQNYDYPVDIEFTVNFTHDNKPIINLLQCRPLQTRGEKPRMKMPDNPAANDILFKCDGYFMGGSIAQKITKIIYVEPQAYIDLTLTEKYDIARLVGKLNRMITDRNTEPTLLLGPGRWGTSTPSLGVPVDFHEINNVTVLAEIAYEGANLMPELSFGTHFFQDLVESDIFYTAIFPGKPNTIFNIAKLDSMPNELAEILPESEKYKNVLKLCNLKSNKLQIISDLTTQKLICLDA